MKDQDEVGNRIRNIRKDLGLSMEKFGELFDPAASKGVVSNWENGYNFPNNERLKTIAELGSITVNELLYGESRVYIESVIRDSSEIAHSEAIENTIDYFSENDIDPYNNDSYILEIYREKLKEVESEISSTSNIQKAFEDLFDNDIGIALRFMLEQLSALDDEELASEMNLEFNGDELDDDTRKLLIKELEKILKKTK